MSDAPAPGRGRPATWRRWPAALGAALAAALLAGCGPTVEIDAEETTTQLADLDGPTVEFDPAAGVVPFPNDLLRDVDGDQRVTLPAGCGEGALAEALRVGVLNRLDGFGTFQPGLTASFSARPDFDSLTDRVRLYRLTDAVGELATPEPVAAELRVGREERFAADCTTSELVDTVTLTPEAPLAGGSRYAVALRDGITSDREPFIPSLTWSLVRLGESPVTVEDGAIVAHATPLDADDDDDRATLIGIEQLWQAHAPVLTALDAALEEPSGELLLAFGFTTHSAAAALDPAVASSPASRIEQQPLTWLTTLLVDPLTGDPIAVADFLTAALGLAPFACGVIGCDAVGDILTGTLEVRGYQVDGFNLLPGGDPIPGAWDDPLAPSGQVIDALPVLAIVPATPPPAAGYPTVIFGHGLGRSKEDLLALAPALAGNGFAAVAIDWVGHGGRAVRISERASDTGTSGAGCDEPLAGHATGDHAHCFAPFFSTDLAVSRDNLRQSALDGMTLATALTACGLDCAPLAVDPNRIGYLGQSLGALVGTLVVAGRPGIGAAVLNAGGAGLIDVVEQTDSLGLRCPLVDGSIAAGLLTGTPYDREAQSGTCTEPGWASQPGWQSFATAARWVLDPADPANYAARLAGRSILVQQIDGDRVIPDVTTESLAELAGISIVERRHADIAHALAPMPSRAVTAGAARGAWVLYADVEADGAFIGNSYHHGSLLAPPQSCQDEWLCQDGALGVERMQVDALTFLRLRLGSE